MRAQLSTMCMVTAGMLLAGCTAMIDGRPVATPPSGIEPTFPTPRPTRETPAPDTTANPGSPAGDLTPQNGFVFIETRSGQTRCQLSVDEVGCESQFTDSPLIDGTPANGVILTPDGKVSWLLGNIGDIPAVTLDYRTYHALGWTIDASADGTRFTNDETGRGMVVAVEGVETF